MSTAREIHAGNTYETIRIKAVLVPFLVRFELPDTIKETMPLTLVNGLEGDRILRFYATPNNGHIIEFRGYIWAVKGLYHQPMVSGSRNVDKMPIVLTEFCGEKP